MSLRGTCQAERRYDYSPRTDYGALAGDGAYLVMERIQGVTFRAELDAHGRLDVPRVGQRFGQLCEGMAEAHSHGVVHRDLKPENLVVQGADSDHPQLKIRDFGLAKVKTSDTDAQSAHLP